MWYPWTGLSLNNSSMMRATTHVWKKSLVKKFVGYPHPTKKVNTKIYYANFLTRKFPKLRYYSSLTHHVYLCPLVVHLCIGIVHCEVPWWGIWSVQASSCQHLPDRSSSGGGSAWAQPIASAKQVAPSPFAARGIEVNLNNSQQRTRHTYSK